MNSQVLYIDLSDLMSAGFSLLDLVSSIPDLMMALRWIVSLLHFPLVFQAVHEDEYVPIIHSISTSSFDTFTTFPSWGISPSYLIRRIAASFPTTMLWETEGGEEGAISTGALQCCLFPAFGSVWADLLRCGQQVINAMKYTCHNEREYNTKLQDVNLSSVKNQS